MLRLLLGGESMSRTCQYCSKPVVSYRMVLTIHNIGGECVTPSSGHRPAGIISVYRHHPVAVCRHHWGNLPKHIRHCQNERSLCFQLSPLCHIIWILVCLVGFATIVLLMMPGFVLHSYTCNTEWVYMYSFASGGRTRTRNPETWMLLHRCDRPRSS